MSSTPRKIVQQKKKTIRINDIPKVERTGNREGI